MTIVSEPDRKKQNSSVGNITQGDIPAALEAAGINDPLIAQKVLESLAAINNIVSSYKKNQSLYFILKATPG